MPSSAAVVWSEDFEGVALGATSGSNADLPGSVIQTANTGASTCVDATTDPMAAAAFTFASGKFIRLSTGNNNYTAIRPSSGLNPITFVASYAAGESYRLSFDLYIPSTLAVAVGDVQFRWNNQTSGDGATTYTDFVQSDSGQYHVTYSGTIPDLGAAVTSARPFIGIDQAGAALNDYLYLDNIQFVINGGSTNGGGTNTPPLNQAYFNNLRANPVTSTPLVRWQEFGPGMSGYIDDFWINNGDPNAMYDDLDMGNGHVTLNRGEYWSTYRGVDGDGKDPEGVTCLDFSFQDPDFGIMIGKNATYHTTNRGRAWIKRPAAGSAQMHSVVAVDPSNDNNWYIGAGQSMMIKETHYTKSGIDKTGNFSEGFIVYSKNKGVSWTQVSSPFPTDSSFSRIIVDPRNSNIVYASCQHGVYKSTNGGASWAKVTGTGLPYNQPRDMGYYYNESTDEFLLYIVELTHYDISGPDIMTTGGVYRSADGGTTWDNLTGDLAINLNQISAWGYLDKFRRAVLWWNELPQSTTYAAFYSTYNKPTNTFSQFHQMAVDPNNKDRIYLVHNFKHDYSFPPGDIWMTENGGTNWFAAAREGTYWKNQTDKAYWQSRAVQPLGINTKFAHVEKEHNEADNTQSGPRFVRCNQLGEVYTAFAQQMMRSTDHGATWNQIDDDETEPGNGHWVGRGNSNLPGETFCLDTGTPGTYLWGSGEHGLWRNMDDGDKVYPGAIAVKQLTGQSISANSPLSISTIATDPQNPAHVYMIPFRQDMKGELLYSANGGDTWTSRSNPMQSFYNGGNDVIDSRSLMIDHQNANNIYFCIPFSEWERWSGDFVSNGRMVTGEPAFFGQGIYKSTNGGSTFSAITNGIPPTSSVYRMAMDPVNPFILYAALNETHNKVPGGLYKTTNGGANWSQVTLPGNVVSVNNVKIQKTTGDIYIACGAWSDAGETGGGFISQDGGATWHMVFDMPYVRHFVPSQVDPKIIAVNVDKAQSIGSRNPGAYVTVDGGTNWFKINQHHGQPEGIRKIEPDPYDKNVLWMSLHGTGFFRADISPLFTGQTNELFFWEWMAANGQMSMFADTDLDGHDSRQEFVTGTDPANPASVFQAEALPNGGAGIKVRFGTVLQRVYAVDYKDSLQSGWMTLTNGIPGTGGTVEMLQNTSATNRFYCVRVAFSP